jgi:hypothetical protein
MRLLTDKILSQLPGLDTTQRIHPGKIIVPCRLILPGTICEWFPIEFDRIYTFFGLVRDTNKVKWDYFILDELEQLRGPFHSTVIRSPYFRRCTVKDLLLYYDLTKVTRPIE